MVGLAAPPLALALARSRALTAHARSDRLDLRSATSVAYLRELAAAQRALAARVERSIPQTRIRWRYRIVVDGLAVVVPTSRLAALARVRGVARVYPNVRYRSLLDTSPELIGADALWGPTLATAGEGMKIGIVDDGLDQSHPFFSPAGYTMPPGFPKGQRAFTTAKVIVARAFPPPGSTWKYAGRPYDPEQSDHATHVAGIAAGDHGTGARLDGSSITVSGVAPRAWIGNYKVLTQPTASGVGLDGNAAEIAAGIEAAVADGMDVINLSLGEPEIAPTRDLVVDAIDGAAAAGVVPAVAAGNDFDEFGPGSVGSPGTAPGAITAAAASKSDVIADFSSGGPTPLSLLLKPDVTAPGVGIISSVPPRESLWGALSGTSMASPHVAGAAALLLQRHPHWTVPQVKSALVLTGGPVYLDAGHTRELPASREGGGMIDLRRADDPLVFAAPAGLSFGLLKVGATSARTVQLSDAGGGAGTWNVSVQRQDGPASVTAPATVSVPGALTVTASATGTAEGDTDGFVVLSRGSDTRRIPFWLRVENPGLGREPHRTLTRPGLYAADTRGGASLVSTYRYPELTAQAGIATRLSGPERVYRVTISRPVANFGVAIVSRGRGVQVAARIVAAGDENRLLGYTALPLDLNPYLAGFEEPTPAVGVVRPTRGPYDVVFDTPGSAALAGPFGFRFWVDDTTPPAVRMLGTTVPRAGGRLTLAVTDAGSGVDPSTFVARVDGVSRDVAYDAGTGRAAITTGVLAAGPHRLSLQVSDYQETKNMEDVPPILPNTRAATFAFTAR